MSNDGGIGLDLNLFYIFRSAIDDVGVIMFDKHKDIIHAQYLNAILNL